MSYEYRFDRIEHQCLSFNNEENSLCLNLRIRSRLSGSSSSLKLIEYDNSPRFSNCIKSIFTTLYIVKHEYLDDVMTDGYLLGSDTELGMEVHSKGTMSSIIKYLKKKLIHEDI